MGAMDRLVSEASDNATRSLPGSNKVLHTFIDLFSGIGGFHFVLSSLGLKCVYASEIDKFARKTYEINFKPDYLFNDDITKADINEIPQHDILCAGFPCQPFSQAGFKKGFGDKRNLFSYICRIAQEKKPKVLFLENVRHLLRHDDGKTFKTIIRSIEGMGYYAHYKVLKASDYNLPQHRPRLYIICFDRDIPFQFPEKKELTTSLSQLFNGQCNKKIGYTLRVGGRGSRIHDRRNWDSYIVNGKPFTIGVGEGLKMMGYPDDFIMPNSLTQSMKQLGNSVAIPVIRDITKSILQHYV